MRIINSLFIIALAPLLLLPADHKERPKEECITQEKPDVRLELCAWALKELVEQNKHEAAEREKEKRNKWLVGAVGVVTTITPLAVIILELSKDKESDCPTSQQPNSGNYTG